MGWKDLHYLTVVFKRDGSEIWKTQRHRKQAKSEHEARRVLLKEYLDRGYHVKEIHAETSST